MRISKSQVSLIISQYKKRGFTIESSTKDSKYNRLVLRNKDKVVTILTTCNGWVKII